MKRWYLTDKGDDYYREIEWDFENRSVRWVLILLAQDWPSGGLTPRVLKDYFPMDPMGSEVIYMAIEELVQEGLLEER